MKIEYHAAKDRGNREKHGVSLAKAIEVLMSAHTTFQDTRFDYPEPRYVTYGALNGRLYCLVYAVPAPETVRAISLRKANRREVERYG